MNVLLWPLLFAWFAALHWLIGQYAAFFGSGPSVFLAATVCCAIACAPATAITFGFFAGLFADFMAVHLFGGYALIFVLVAYLVGFAKTRIYFETPGAQFSLGVAVTLFCIAAYAAEAALLLEHPLPVTWQVLVLSPLYNGLLCVCAFPFFLLFRPVRRISSGGILDR